MVSTNVRRLEIARRKQVHPFVERTRPRGASHDHLHLGEGSRWQLPFWQLLAGLWCISLGEE